MTNLTLANSGVSVTKMPHHEISKLTGKKADHVVRDIENMLGALGEDYPKMDNYDSKWFL
ncbi:hypothetical protein FBF86_21035 [Serratia marcescens]|uniref:hypothetical protein n=1 Tax=Serratia marcescens TaxID=615 RepID=UPI0011548F4A|nr:hypothetical protein [Serratia marcescens]QDI20311.1 hypothetical protein FBF86_21035 [Serratia marcescens]QDI30055.1 hypothetical protein FG169_21035 [Serratia marcescens]